MKPSGVFGETQGEGLNMKLSEAIRLGAMLKPQGYGDPGLRKVLRQGPPSSCAIEAALDAVGVVIGDFGYLDDVMEHWPWVTVDISAAIWRHNDTDRWSREQIADWVQTLEPHETPPAIERTPVEVFAVARTHGA